MAGLLLVSPSTKPSGSPKDEVFDHGRFGQGHGQVAWGSNMAPFLLGSENELGAYGHGSKIPNRLAPMNINQPAPLPCALPTTSSTYQELIQFGCKGTTGRPCRKGINHRSAQAKKIVRKSAAIAHIRSLPTHTMKVPDWADEFFTWALGLDDERLQTISSKMHAAAHAEEHDAAWSQIYSLSQELSEEFASVCSKYNSKILEQPDLKIFQPLK